MKLTIAASFVAMLACQGAVAQPIAPTPVAPSPLSPLPLAPDAGSEPSTARTSERLALANRYILAAHFDQVMRREIDLAFPSLIGGLLKSRPDLPQQFAPEFVRAAREMVVDLLPKLREKAAEAIASIYTTEELEALVSFYESPVGVSIGAKSISLMQVTAASMKALAPEMSADLLRRVCARAGCPPSLNGRAFNGS